MNRPPNGSPKDSHAQGSLNALGHASLFNLLVLDAPRLRGKTSIEREAKHICSVDTDNYMGGLQATSLLIRNHCDILILSLIHILAFITMFRVTEESMWSQMIQL